MQWNSPKIALKVSPKLISAVFPKKHSKILAGIKHKEEIGARRAQKFMNTCQQIAELREQKGLQWLDSPMYRQSELISMTYCTTSWYLAKFYLVA